MARQPTIQQRTAGMVLAACGGFVLTADIIGRFYLDHDFWAGERFSSIYLGMAALILGVILIVADRLPPI